MNKISLLIVEDHEGYSNVLQDLLIKDENIQLVEVVRTAEDGLEKLGKLDVDLVLVDLGLPKMDGITFVELVHDQYPNLLCLMVSAHLSPESAQRSLQAGARGYVLKDNYSGILEGIWCVINGGTYLSKELGK